jgi:hypothetical protein
MAIGVDSRAKRILTPLTAYRELSEPADLTNLLEAWGYTGTPRKALPIQFCSPPQDFTYTAMTVPGFTWPIQTSNVRFFQNPKLM